MAVLILTVHNVTERTESNMKRLMLMATIGLVCSVSAGIGDSRWEPWAVGAIAGAAVGLFLHEVFWR